MPTGIVRQIPGGCANPPLHIRRRRMNLLEGCQSLAVGQAEICQNGVEALVARVLRAVAQPIDHLQLKRRERVVL